MTNNIKNWDKIWADFCHHIKMNYDKQYQLKNKRK